MDRSLRELERAFKESGAPEDHLAYLCELVRAGARCAEGAQGCYGVARRFDVDVV